MNGILSSTFSPTEPSTRSFQSSISRSFSALNSSWRFKLFLETCSLKHTMQTSFARSVFTSKDDCIWSLSAFVSAQNVKYYVSVTDLLAASVSRSSEYVEMSCCKASLWRSRAVRTLSSCHLSAECCVVSRLSSAIELANSSASLATRFGYPVEEASTSGKWLLYLQSFLSRKWTCFRNVSTSFQVCRLQ